MISEFVAMLGKYHHAKSSLFHVEIQSVPALMQRVQGLGDFQREFKFLCSGAEMPGTQLLTQENRIYDLSQKYAYMKAHDELTLTVRVDKNYLSKKFFDAWEDSVYNRDTGNVFYKSSYVGQIHILPMIEDGACPYAMALEDCFPTQIGNISYSWESSGQIAQFNVTLSFTKKKIVAREALFTMAGNRGGSGNNVLEGATNSSFDVMGGENVKTFRDNVYSSVNKAFTDGMTQHVTMASSPIDLDSIRNKFKF